MHAHMKPIKNSNNSDVACKAEIWIKKVNCLIGSNSFSGHFSWGYEHDYCEKHNFNMFEMYGIFWILRIFLTQNKTSMKHFNPKNEHSYFLFANIWKINLLEIPKNSICLIVKHIFIVLKQIPHFHEKLILWM